jgi:hypothetical protein
LKLTDGTQTVYQQFWVQVWKDSDGDGRRDGRDAFPHDKLEWKDSDKDSVGDNSDVDPDDPSEWNDRDRDGVGDNSDVMADGRRDSVGLFLRGSRRFYVRRLVNSRYVWRTVPVFGSKRSAYRPIAGDWDGDGGDTVGMYDPVAKRFVLYRERNAVAKHIKFRVDGAKPGLEPVVGDWNGYRIVGRADRAPTVTVGLYDPNTGKVAIKNANRRSVIGPGVRFGPAGSRALPMAGDWDGDGIDTIGVYDHVRRRFWLAKKHVGGKRVSSAPWAGVGWLPFAGDWNGDGKDEPGLYDPAKCVFHLSRRNGKELANRAVKFSVPGVDCSRGRPVAGAWQPTRLVVPEPTLKIRQVSDRWVFTAGPDRSPENNPRYNLVVEENEAVTLRLETWNNAAGKQAKPKLFVLNRRGQVIRSDENASKRSVAQVKFLVDSTQTYVVVAASHTPYLADAPYQLKASQATRGSDAPLLVKDARYKGGPVPPNRTLTILGEWRCTGGAETFANPSYLFEVVREHLVRVELKILRGSSKDDLGTVSPVLYLRSGAGGALDEGGPIDVDTAVIERGRLSPGVYQIVAGTDRSGFPHVLHQVKVTGPIESLRAARGNQSLRGVCDRNRR